MQKEVGLLTHSCSFIIQPRIVGSSKTRGLSIQDFSSWFFSLLTPLRRSCPHVALDSMVLWFLGRTTPRSLHSHLPVLHPLFGQPGRRHRAAGLSWCHTCWCSYDAEATQIFSHAFIVYYKLTHCISLTQAERDNLLFDATFSHLETSQVWTGNLSWKTLNFSLSTLPAPRDPCPSRSHTAQVLTPPQSVWKEQGICNCCLIVGKHRVMASRESVNCIVTKIPAVKNTSLFSFSVLLGYPCLSENKNNTPPHPKSQTHFKMPTNHCKCYSSRKKK